MNETPNKTLNLNNPVASAEFNANIAAAKIESAVKDALQPCFNFGGHTHLTIGTQTAITKIMSALFELNEATGRALNNPALYIEKE